MKGIIESLAAIFSIILIMASCSSDKDEAGYIKINGTSYALTYGLVNDTGTSEDISYRSYWIKFQSSSGDLPAHFMVFNLYSNSLTKIGEGTYTYENFHNQAGEFSWVKVGYNIQYDDIGERVGGTILLDSNISEGTIVISKTGEDLKFEFNMTYSKNNILYTVEGEFKDILYEGYVHY